MLIYDIIITMTAAEKLSGEINKPSQSGLFRLITKQAVNNAVLMHLLRHDPLTGLLNQQANVFEIQRRMQGTKPFGVIELDLDAFKKVNDTKGHPVGDRLLEGFGSHLQLRFRRAGEVAENEKIVWSPVSENTEEVALARTGGDEFNVVVDLSDRGRQDGLSVVQRMDNTIAYSRHILSEFVMQQDASIRELEFGVSIGGAIWLPGSSETMEELVGRADFAMYEDKRARGAPIR
jgi:GGDEF domain-containing protein